MSAALQSPYLRVKQFLKGGLSRGHWMPGALMPSEAELVAQFGVSRMTVNRALRELQGEGLIERVQGVGTFAAQLYPMSSTLTIRDLHAEIEARGHRHHAVVKLQREERAPPALAAQLGLAEGAPVFHTQVLHHDNGLPLQSEDRYVNPACAPGYLATDFSRITPTQYLLEVAPLWQANYSIEAGTATAEDAGWLDIDPVTPCLVVVRRTERDGAVITLARLVHPGSRYVLQGAFRP